MAKKSRKPKAPVYNAEDAAILKSAKMDHRVKHPPGTVKAVDAVNLAQRGRISHISLQERVVKDSDGRIDTCRAAIVSPLSSALKHLPDDARRGLEIYHEIYFAAMPSETIDYSDTRASGERGDRPLADPHYMKLALLNAFIGKKATQAAEWAVRLQEGAEIVQGSLALAMASEAGKRVWQWDEG